MRHSLRVLLVDDSEDSRLLVRAFLGKAVQSLETAEDGRIGAEKFARALADDGIDLVLMDLRMPVMDGCESARRMREHEARLGRGSRRVPIIALSGADRDDDKARALAAGCDACLAKPVSRAALLALIGGWPKEGDAGDGTG